MKVTAIILISIYSIALVKPALPLIDYYFKTQAYLEGCINKNRPELQCNGQCILMQKLKAFNAETNTAAAPAPVKITLQDFPIGFIQSLTLEIPLPGRDQSFYQNFPSALSDHHPAEFFHPPSHQR